MQTNFGEAVRNFKSYMQAQQYGPALFWLGFMTRHAEEFGNYTAIQAIATLASKMMQACKANDPDHDRLNILTMEGTVMAAFGRK